ncbi:MAG: acyl-CoA dehydrogenase family protein [Candidatus Hodarchaeota archaeon]
MDFQFTDEQLAIHKEIRKFSQKELNRLALERDKSEEFSWDGWKKCAEIGIQGLPISEEYGGSAADALTTILAMEGLGYGCEDNGLIHSINSHMWGCEIPILNFGTDEQKQKYLPDLCRGEAIGGHAVTEPDAGSDAFALKTEAKKRNNYYLLNGSKSIVSNAPISDLIIVFAVTNPSRKFLGGISAFIVEKNAPGLVVGEPLEKMGLKTSPTAELFFEDCKVPLENLLGNEGSGMPIFTETMEWERSCLFACHVGTMERILETCIRYAKNRHQFGQPIGKFQSISNKIADMKVNLELGRLILYKIGWMKNQRKNVLLETAIAKLFVSGSLTKSTLEAVQIHGAYGYLSELGIEKDLRDSIASNIYSGTSEIQRNIIARCLGL